MQTPQNTARVLPDVASEPQGAIAGALDWVGMSGIEIPVSIAGAGGAVTPARVTACVNLARPDARGIHMSRLYLHVDRALTSEALTPCVVRRTLRDFLETHRDLSDRALLRVELSHLVRRRALVSEHSGWRAYPVSIAASLERGHYALELGVSVAYSSTCPCSAALARQLIQERFASQFAADAPLERDTVLAWLGTAQGISATPHAQRSVADVRVRLVPSFASFPILDLVDLVEGALGTPVQAAVKREDEQAFARLNGENPMFCEDAARRIQTALDHDERIADFWVRASHHESLHPHDAVAIATKGVPGGYAGSFDPRA